jgi:hypothetical protein
MTQSFESTSRATLFSELLIMELRFHKVYDGIEVDPRYYWPQTVED